MHYSTNKKETLALVLALSNFAVYFYTNHNPLVFLWPMSNSNPCLMRWNLLLQGHILVICHFQRKENILADVLTRSWAAISMGFTEFLCLAYLQYKKQFYWSQLMVDQSSKYLTVWRLTDFFKVEGCTLSFVDSAPYRAGPLEFEGSITD